MTGDCNRESDSPNSPLPVPAIDASGVFKDYGTGTARTPVLRGSTWRVQPRPDSSFWQDPGKRQNDAAFHPWLHPLGRPGRVRVLGVELLPASVPMLASASAADRPGFVFRALPFDSRAERFGQRLRAVDVAESLAAEGPPARHGAARSGWTSRPRASRPAQAQRRPVPAGRPGPGARDRTRSDPRRRTDGLARRSQRPDGRNCSGGLTSRQRQNGCCGRTTRGFSILPIGVLAENGASASRRTRSSTHGAAEGQLMTRFHPAGGRAGSCPGAAHRSPKPAAGRAAVAIAASIKFSPWRIEGATRKFRPLRKRAASSRPWFKRASLSQAPSCWLDDAEHAHGGPCPGRAGPQAQLERVISGRPRAGGNEAELTRSRNWEVSSLPAGRRGCQRQGHLPAGADDLRTRLAA